MCVPQVGGKPSGECLVCTAGERLQRSRSPHAVHLMSTSFRLGWEPDSGARPALHLALFTCGDQSFLLGLKISTSIEMFS